MPVPMHGLFGSFCKFLQNMYFIFVFYFILWNFCGRTFFQKKNSSHIVQKFKKCMYFWKKYAYQSFIKKLTSSFVSTFVSVFVFVDTIFLSPLSAIIFLKLFRNQKLFPKSAVQSNTWHLNDYATIHSQVIKKL